MKPVLYYSEYCQHCNCIIQSLSQTNLNQSIHFIKIDKRTVEDNTVKILLDNGTYIPLPPNIKRVPSLLYSNSDNQVVVLVGNDIKNYIFEMMNAQKEINNDISLEPESFMFQTCGMFVYSDYYSFLDQNSDELSAKGNGGLRQMYNHATYNIQDSIKTPNEDYVPDTIKDVSLEKLIEQRDQDIHVSSHTQPSIMPR